MSQTETGWQASVPLGVGTNIVLLAVPIVQPAYFDNAASWTEMSQSADSMTEMSQTATTWTEMTG